MKEEIRYNSFEYYETSGYQLKFWIIKQFEDKLKEISGKDGYRSADVNFAYHNSWLLDGLRVRGEHIKAQDWEEVNKCNREITDKIH